MENKRLALSIPDAAKALSLSAWTLRKWIAAGKMQSIRLGRRIVIEPAELYRLLDSGRVRRKPGNQLVKIARNCVCYRQCDLDEWIEKSIVPVQELSPAKRRN